jgi:hypothetical protein
MEFDFYVEGMTREQAESLLETIKVIVEAYGLEMAGGLVEIREVGGDGKES